MNPSRRGSRPVTAVVALGGHSFIKQGQKGTIQEQFANARAILMGLVGLLKKGYQMVITHGNGPQVGASLIRNEVAKGLVPELPLGFLVATTEGGIGYMIEQSLLNIVQQEGLKIPVLTLLTQVVVDPEDPSLKRPVKPVGPVYSEEKAKELKSLGYAMKLDPGRGYRRVVPSPYPLEIVENQAIRLLLASGGVVVAAGGGGIPVFRQPDGTLEGVDCVVDKDLASMVLARDIGADLLIMLTSVDCVYSGFGTKRQKPLRALTVRRARDLLLRGTFAEGSMAPKVRAAVEFVETGGREAFIGAGEDTLDIVAMERGTRVAP